MSIVIQGHFAATLWKLRRLTYEGAKNAVEIGTSRRSPKGSKLQLLGWPFPSQMPGKLRLRANNVSKLLPSRFSIA
jgi:hypothetical protein